MKKFTLYITFIFVSFLVIAQDPIEGYSYQSIEFLEKQLRYAPDQPYDVMLCPGEYREYGNGPRCRNPVESFLGALLGTMQDEQETTLQAFIKKHFGEQATIQKLDNRKVTFYGQTNPEFIEAFNSSGGGWIIFIIGVIIFCGFVVANTTATVTYRPDYDDTLTAGRTARSKEETKTNPTVPSIDTLQAFQQQRAASQITPPPIEPDSTVQPRKKPKNARKILMD